MAEALGCFFLRTLVPGPAALCRGFFLRCARKNDRMGIRPCYPIIPARRANFSSGTIFVRCEVFILIQDQSHLKQEFKIHQPQRGCVTKRRVGPINESYPGKYETPGTE